MNALTSIFFYFLSRLSLQLISRVMECSGGPEKTETLSQNGTALQLRHSSPVVCGLQMRSSMYRCVDGTTCRVKFSSKATHLNRLISSTPSKLRGIARTMREISTCQLALPSDLPKWDKTGVTRTYAPPTPSGTLSKSAAGVRYGSKFGGRALNVAPMVMNRWRCCQPTWWQSQTVNGPSSLLIIPWNLTKPPNEEEYIFFFFFWIWVGNLSGLDNY